MKHYKFTIISDQGTHKVSTIAKNLASALQRIINAEKCPEGAIINIKIKELGHAKNNK